MRQVLHVWVCWQVWYALLGRTELPHPHKVHVWGRLHPALLQGKAALLELSLAGDTAGELPCNTVQKEVHAHLAGGH